MCGICGEVAQAAGRVDPVSLDAMIASLSHRGPDDTGSHLAPGVGLGHRRLSIIDLGGGHQPMSNRDHTLWIVFNGEIYNYRALRRELSATGYPFQTNSDTEVLLALYEASSNPEDFLRRLEGMFAFAVWDARAKRLLLARDRVGIKPLYLWCDAERLVFGSELKAMLRHPTVPRELDLDALALYLTLGYIPAPKTIFQHIEKLLPGTYVVWSEGRLTRHSYWDVAPSESTTAQTEDDVLDRLGTLLDEAVSSHLVSDVPVGVLLSGGVDSSLVTAAVARHRPGPLQTFSIGFPQAGAYDERRYAHMVARQFRTDHHEETVRVDATDVIPQLVQAFDEPFADSSALPMYYVSRMARRSVKVVLSGTGGDDLWGGYRRYRFPDLARRVGRWPSWCRATGRWMLKDLPASRASRLGSMVLDAKRLMAYASSGPAGGYLKLISCVHPDVLPSLAPGLSPRYGWFEELRRGPEAENGALLARIWYAELKSYLADDLLVKEDRMSMAHGLEARVPLLDHRLVEFAWQVPAELKVKGTATKYLLRRLAARWVSPAIARRRKQGFGVPIAEWLRGPLRAMAHDVLFSTVARQRGLFQPRAVERLLQEHQCARRDHSQALWALLMFEWWAREYLDQVPCGSCASSRA